MASGQMCLELRVEAWIGDERFSSFGSFVEDKQSASNSYEHFMFLGARYYNSYKSNFLFTSNMCLYHFHLIILLTE